MTNVRTEIAGNDRSTVSFFDAHFAATERLVDHEPATDEVDPYAKPKDLLEVSPKGLVPGLKLNEFSPPRGLNESTVILEYLEECVPELWYS